MECLGLYSESGVMEILADNACIDYTEGTLLDNFIFYNNKDKKYYLCMEYVLNEWSSCYQVYMEGGNGSTIFDMWDEIIENMACIA